MKNQFGILLLSFSHQAANQFSKYLDQLSFRETARLQAYLFPN